jgi:CRP-like cAMP-binding protein
MHTGAMNMRTWRGRLWFGLTISFSTSVVMLVGPTYIRPLPMSAQLVLAVACVCFIAAVAIYGRRRARGAPNLP